MLRRTFLVALMSSWAGAASADAPRFEVGQVWSLATPANPEARIRIGRIDAETVHISLWGVPGPPGGSDLIGSPMIASHLPISPEALARSVDRIVQDTPPENLQFEDGYQTWLREANGGTFTITVMEIVQVMYEIAGPGGE
jgi:hypothetical protein